MKRLAETPRLEWETRVESKGLLWHHPPDATPYWTENASYSFSLGEILALEAVTAELHARCLDGPARDRP